MRKGGVLVLIGLLACGLEEESEPDDTVFAPDAKADAAGIVEGSADARGVLTVANEATYFDLVDGDRVGLSRRSASNIMAYRKGGDGVEGTGDDRAFDTVARLDAVPYVGTATLSRLLSFARAQGLTQPPACQTTSPRTLPATAFVTPDDGSGPVLDLLAGARHSLDVVMYQLSYEPAVEALEAAAQRGVAVRVILDRTQDSSPAMKARLEAAGAEVELSSEAFAYTHQKSIVVDHRTALVFTGNLDGASLHNGRNFGVIEPDWQDVVDLTRLVDADWRQEEPDLSCTRLVVSPVNAADRILDLIRRARRTLRVEALYITDSRVADELIAAHQRGVNVKVLINDPSFGFSDGAVGRQLQAAGIDARHSDRTFIHAKLIVADGLRGFIGSENFSWNSLERNREVGVVMDYRSFDVARVVDTFEADFAAGVSF